MSLVKNLASFDRIARVVLGLVFLAIGFGLFASSLPLLALFVVLAVIMFGTATMSYCPIYGLFGFSTLKK